jgi:hypothetical protein
VTGGALKPKIPVTIVDRYGTYTPTLVDMHRICTPADKNGEDPTAPTNPNHEAAYFPSTTSSVTLATGVTVTNQFGTFKMDVRGFNRLLVPTAKKLVPPAPNPLPKGAIPHFACHNVANIKGPPLNHTAVTVVDQFTSTPIPGFVLQSKWKLCVSADKNGEDPGAENKPDALFCFFAANTPPFGTKPLFLNNQFGPNQFANHPVATQYDELCVPSTLP